MAVLIVLDSRERRRPAKVHTDAARLRRGLEELLARLVKVVLLHINVLALWKRAVANRLGLCVDERTCVCGREKRQRERASRS